MASLTSRVGAEFLTLRASHSTPGLPGSSLGVESTTVAPLENFDMHSPCTTPCQGAAGPPQGDDSPLGGQRPAQRRSVGAKIGRWLSRYLAAPGRTTTTGFPTDQTLLRACLQPGDVLLVEGTSRISTAIKYLTQSTWSHAALYVGTATGRMAPDGQALSVIEADIVEGVRAVPLSIFKGFHCRVCRPVNLSPDEIQRICAYAVQRMGEQYDMKNVLDLARYLFPTPPVPARWRRRMLALGSGDPTRAICSTLIAQAYQTVRYPILPRIETVQLNAPGQPGLVKEILHVRHYSLFVPRDFDVSPYFQIVKPTVAAGFDPHAVAWNDE